LHSFRSITGDEVMDWVANPATSHLVHVDDTHQWIIFMVGHRYQASYKRKDGVGLANIFISPTTTATGDDMIKMIFSNTVVFPYSFTTVDEAKTACAEMQQKIMMGAPIVGHA
jgi:alcohol dehydrogenase YqhD (iron-dependent ADH family)